MAFGPAYFSDRIRDPLEARDSPIFARLSHAAPWSFCDAFVDGKRGLLAFWGDGGAAPLPEAYGKPRTCPDGLMYLPPGIMPTQAELAQTNGVAGVEYTTSRGVTLTIPTYANASRYLSFSDIAFGAPADEFAKVSEQVRDAIDTIKIDDPLAIRLVMLAIMRNYRTTPELLDDLRWVTSRDVDPIWNCTRGSDPKATADAGNTLPLPVSASSQIHA